MGTVLVIAAVLRVGAFGGDLTARATQTDMPPEGPINSFETSTLCKSDSDLQRVLVHLIKREKALHIQENDFTRRSVELNKREAIAESRLVMAKDAETRLRKTMVLSETIAETDLLQLTTVYEKMKPKNAAAVFEEMDPSFSAGFLGRMMPEAAAAIMATLPPQSALAISVVLAGRNSKAGILR